MRGWEQSFCLTWLRESRASSALPQQRFPRRSKSQGSKSRDSSLPQASGALREQLQLGQFGSQLLSVSSPPLPEGARWEVSPRLGKDAWMCRRGWAEDRAGHSSPGKRSSPVPSGAPGALPAVLFSVRETPEFTLGLCSCRGDFGP